MLRNALRSRWTWIWTAVVAVVANMAITHYRNRDSYPRALAALGVQPSTYAAEMAGVVDSVLSHVPIGSPLNRVVAFLDSLGLRRSPDPFDERPAFRVDSTRGDREIYAHWPYDDSPFSADHYVCDPPALRLILGFDDAWKLKAAEANTAQGCI